MLLKFNIFSQGKYIEIQFSKGGEPEGGKVSNFLLEKVMHCLCLCILMFSFIYIY